MKFKKEVFDGLDKYKTEKGIVFPRNVIYAIGKKQ
jgi:hypothetical protein